MAAIRYRRGNGENAVPNPCRSARSIRGETPCAGRSGAESHPPRWACPAGPVLGLAHRPARPSIPVPSTPPPAAPVWLAEISPIALYLHGNRVLTHLNAV